MTLNGCRSHVVHQSEALRNISGLISLDTLLDSSAPPGCLCKLIWTSNDGRLSGTQGSGYMKRRPSLAMLPGISSPLSPVMCLLVYAVQGCSNWPMAVICVG